MDDLQRYFFYVNGMASGAQAVERESGCYSPIAAELFRESERVYFAIHPEYATDTTHRIFPWLREELRSKFDE